MTFEEAKLASRCIDGADVCRALGIPMKHVGKNDTIICPSPTHADRKKGNCIVYPGTGKHRGGYYCWACGAQGSNVDLVMQTLGVDESDAFTFIFKNFNIPYSFEDEPKKEHKTIVSAKEYRELGLYMYCHIPKKYNDLIDEKNIYGMELLKTECPEEYDTIIYGKGIEKINICRKTILDVYQLAPMQTIKEEPFLQTLLDYCYEEISTITKILTKGMVQKKKLIPLYENIRKLKMLKDQLVS